jgi:RimJ/RimL family protein N-acetyltransferase
LRGWTEEDLGPFAALNADRRVMEFFPTVLGRAASAAAALGFGFGDLGLDEIVSFTVPANERSRRVMEGLGMRRAAAGDFEHPGLPAGHPLRRHVLYRLARGAGSEPRRGGRRA